MAFPDAGILDDFNRANEGQPLSSAWTNGLATANGHKVVSNTARGNATGNTFSSYWNAGTFAADQHAYLTVTARPGNNNDIIIYLRCTSPGAATVDGYAMKYWQRTGTDEFIFYEVNNGGLTQIGTAKTQEVANGDQIGFEVVGSTLSAYWGTGGVWTLVGTETDTAVTGAGYIGFGNWQSSTTAPTLDDFGGGATGSAPATTYPARSLMGVGG